MYYVVHPDGSRYGPADLPTLQAWATEGRLVQATTLIDATTGQQMIAGRVPGLVWGHNPAAASSQPTVLPGQMSQNPYGGVTPGQITQAPYGGAGHSQGYPRYGGYPQPSRQSSLAMVAMICGISSVACVCVCMPLGVVSGVAGMIAASSAKAKGDTNTGWYTALNGAGVVINLGLLAIFFALKAKMGGQ